jgi:hypothetical protein
MGPCSLCILFGLRVRLCVAGGPAQFPNNYCYKTSGSESGDDIRVIKVVETS